MPKMPKAERNSPIVGEDMPKPPLNFRADGEAPFAK